VKRLVVEVLLRRYHRETVFTTRSGMKTSLLNLDKTITSQFVNPKGYDVAVR